jgi:hypothetical protein
MSQEKTVQLSLWFSLCGVSYSMKKFKMHKLGKTQPIFKGWSSRQTDPRKVRCWVSWPGFPNYNVCGKGKVDRWGILAQTWSLSSENGNHKTRDFPTTNKESQVHQLNPGRTNKRKIVCIVDTPQPNCGRPKKWGKKADPKRKGSSTSYLSIKNDRASWMPKGKCWPGVL